MNRTQLRERGLRNPRHTFGVMHSSHLLMPTMVAPLRPGETLIGLRMRARSMLNRVVMPAVSPPIEVEYAVWKVPVRSIGAFFVDMFVNDPNDIGSIEVGTMGLPEIAPLPINEQGPRSHTPLQVRDRLWAGENGQQDGEVSIAPAAAYAPYVSQGIWHIARSWYALESMETTLADSSEIGSLPQASTVDSANLHQNPPKIGRLIRTTLSSGIGVGGNSDATPTTLSLTDWAMRLSVLDNANRSWPEYLKAQGVDPNRIESMPEPILMQRRLLEPFGSPQVAFGAAPTNVNYVMTGINRRNGYYAGGDQSIVNAGAASGGLFGHFTGMTGMGTKIDQTRGKRSFIEEPSLLIGTMMFRPYDFDQRSGAHVFDAVYMINSGVWGDSTGNGVDERDMILSRAIDRANEQATGGTIGSPTGFQNDYGQTSPHAFNFLNLYLNGDTYCNAPSELNRFRPPLTPNVAGANLDAYGTVQYVHADPVNLRLNTFGDVRFGVATDLVN